MVNRVMWMVLVAGLVSLAPIQASFAGDTATRVTLTGMGKALVDANSKMDPSVASATLTVTPADGSAAVVYDVRGWAGVIVAKQGDGKKCDVTGVVSDYNGKKTIIGKSIDVKIIVVDPAPAK